MKGVFLKFVILILASVVAAETSQEVIEVIEVVEEPTVERDPRCPLQNTFDIAILYPHEADCNKFYICAGNGTLIEKSCLPGLEFDTELNVCNWPRGTCYANQLPNARMTWNSMPCTPQLEGAMFANKHDNCKSFIKCSDGKPYQISCGNDLLFNDKTKYCDWEFNVNCLNPNGQLQNKFNLPNCVGIRDGTVFANHQNNCRSFYVCNNGEYIQTTCHGNLIFNEKLGVCDWPENAQCTCDRNCIGGSAWIESQLPTPAHPSGSNW